MPLIGAKPMKDLMQVKRGRVATGILRALARTAPRVWSQLDVPFNADLLDAIAQLKHP